MDMTRKQCYTFSFRIKVWTKRFILSRKPNASFVVYFIFFFIRLQCSCDWEFMLKSSFYSIFFALYIHFGWNVNEWPIIYHEYFIGKSNNDCLGKFRFTAYWINQMIIWWNFFLFFFFFSFFVLSTNELFIRVERRSELLLVCSSDIKWTSIDSPNLIALLRDSPWKFG